MITTKGMAKKQISSVEVSVLCKNCTKLKECLNTRHVAALMANTTYCTRFDNKDKTPRLFPFLQPYEREMIDAQYIYDKKHHGNILNQIANKAF